MAAERAVLTVCIGNHVLYEPQALNCRMPHNHLRTFDILILSRLNSQVRHGYSLAQDLESHSLSSIYHSLHKLEGLQLVEGRGILGEKNPNRTVYSLTPQGQRLLRTECASRVVQTEHKLLQTHSELQTLRWLLRSLIGLRPLPQAGSQFHIPSE